MTSLQIFIPSYTREEALKSLLSNAINDGVHEHARIHVTDDGVCEWDFLRVMERDGYISVHFHDRNLGYARTLLEAIAECSEDYLMLINDDDSIIGEGVRKLQEMPLSSYEFVSTNCLDITGNIVRGGSGEACDINVLNSRSYSQHAPGLVFKVETSRKLMDFLSNRLDVKCPFTSAYPQVALLWGILLLGGRARHESIVAVRESFKSPSQLLINDRAYWHPVARLEQKLAAIELLKSLKDSSQVNQVMVDALICQEEKSLGVVLYESLRAYDDKLSNRFAISLIKARLYDLMHPKK